MRGLGEERRGAREQTADGFGRGDHEIRRQRHQDGHPGLGVGLLGVGLRGAGLLVVGLLGVGLLVVGLFAVGLYTVHCVSPCVRTSRARRTDADTGPPDPAVRSTKPVCPAPTAPNARSRPPGRRPGERLHGRQTAPPRPSEQPHRPARTTRAEGSVPPSDEFPDDGQRLTPHQLGGHGNEVLRPSDGTETRRGSGPGETPDTPEGSPRG
ncbi:DUF6479 family protein [Streptomyces sp. NPDC058200]|uniref:DUF6479 family protein n=1 Tax=Streptomyces sp. NPDC058200 TaxID=3346378 RepID=UPI0036ED541F